MTQGKYVGALIVVLCFAFSAVAVSAADPETVKTKIGANGSFNHNYDLLIDGNVVYQDSPWDGEPCVYWTDLATEFVLDLGKETEITELLVEIDHNDTYLIQTSMNGIDYQTLMTIKPEYGEAFAGMDIMSSNAAHPDYIKELAFKPVKAKYLKLRASEGDDFYSAAEISINHSNVNMIPKPEEKSEEPAIEEPAAGGAAGEEPKKEESKQDEPKKEEPKKTKS
jgi:hypothetical protein